MVIGTQKGRDTKENILRNFGSAHPEGYRKALRLMRLADKFRLPIITLIDTAGAYPGIGAEERHIAEAIAVNLREMMVLRSAHYRRGHRRRRLGRRAGHRRGRPGVDPGERLLLGDQPGGLRGDSVEGPLGGGQSRRGAEDHRQAPAGAGAGGRDRSRTARRRAYRTTTRRPQTLREYLLKHLEQLQALPAADRLKQRYAKFRAFGHFTEKQPAAAGEDRGAETNGASPRPEVRTATSSMLYPLTFQPIFKERVWGGRELERLYHKPLPPGVPIGESWEISDRPGDVSVIANGPLAGKDLRWLMENHAAELLGAAKPHGGPFPAAHQDPRRAGEALASSPSPAGQGRRTRRRAQDRDVVHRRSRPGRGAVCRPETRRHPRRVRAARSRPAPWPSAFIA